MSYNNAFLSGALGKRFFKFVSLVLVIFFVLPAPLPVLAQKPDVPAETSHDEQAKPVPTLNFDISAEPRAETPTVIPDDGPREVIPTEAIPTAGDTDNVPVLEAETEQPDGPQFVEDPVNLIAQTTVKSARGLAPQPTVDNITGGLNFSYPIVTPPGRKGVEPDLALVYNSQDRPVVNLVSLGWSLNIPYIQRINKTGMQNLYSDTYFYSSLDGELASTSATAYIAKVDNGNFNQYNFSSNTWTVQDKSGTIYKFGTSTSARQDNPGNSNEVFKWMIQEIRDPNDNYIRYEYSKEDGQIYPSKIFYTGNGGADGIFEVDFIKETRPDENETLSYATRFQVKNTYRISEIRVKTNGQLSRKYALNYSYTPHNIISLLSSITETGYDENDTPTTLSNFGFQYQQATLDWQLDNSWDFPEDFMYNGYGATADVPGGTNIADVNGDSLPDVVTRADSPPFPLHATSTVWVNNGHGWASSTSWASTSWQPYVVDRHDAGTRLVDVDGDMLPDIFRNQQDVASGIYLNNGSGWNNVSSVWSEPPIPFVEEQGKDRGVRILDINGDGLVDVAKAFGGTGAASIIYLNNGAGWTATSTWSLPQDVAYDNEDLGGRFEDINGDGLIDAAYRSAHQSSNDVYLNNGSGTWYHQTYTVPDPFIDNNKHDTGTRLIDMDDDSLPEIVNFGGGFLYNNGNGWALDPWYYPTEYQDVTLNGQDLGVRMADINSDGLQDQILAKDDTQQVYIKQGNKAAVLSTITSNLGATTTVEYKTSANYRNGDGSLKNPHLPVLLDTVNKITYRDSVSPDRTYEYSYEDGSYYYNGPHDRKFAGFGLVETTDPAGNVTKTYFHQGNGTASTNGEYEDHISKLGKPYRVEQYDDAENLYSKTINKWDRTDLGYGASFIKLADSVEFSYDGDDDHKEKAVSLSYNNTNGNLSQKIEYGRVDGDDDGTFSDTGSDKFITSLTYATSTATSTITLPSKETVTDQSGSKVRENKIYYDNQSFGSLTNGNPTKQEFWKSGSSYIDTEKTYNSFGLVTEEKDPRDKTTTYTYDAFNLYVSTSTNPLSQNTAFTYDYSAGKPKQVKDVNGFVFQTVFDGLDRPIEEKQPDLTTPTSLVTRSIYEYTDSGSLPRAVHKKNYLNSATSTDSYTYLDGFGRVVQERVEAEDSDTFSVKDTKYNSIGKVLKESLPYFSTGTTTTAATSDDDLYTNYEYDPLGRVTSIENTLGETTNEYDDWKLTVTDPDSKVKKLYKDAYENLIKVEEVNGANTYTTEYEYDGNKNLTKITDALDNIRDFTYDGLGRRLTAQDLHDSGDSYFGTWFYAYDDAGNVASTTDPKSQNVVYTYDDLNRPTVENYLGTAGNEIIYGYDSCANGVGRLCSATSSSIVLNNQYNALGGIKKETKEINSVNYVASYSYDRLGNMVSIAHPDESLTLNTYNTAGQLEAINWSTTTEAAIPVVKDIDYSPLGQISYMQYGNNATTTNTYDPDELYRLSNKKTRFNTNTYQDLSYSYTPAGDITKIIDTSGTLTAKTTDFAYDDLHRLTSASTTNATSTNYLETYSYNAIGDITSKSDQGNYSYTGTTTGNYANPHAATIIGGGSLTYDRNGNLLTLYPYTHTWNYRNELTESSASSTTSFTYDTTGERLSVTDATSTVVYVNKLYSRENEDNTKYFYAGDTQVATIISTPNGEGEIEPEGPVYGGGAEPDGPECCIQNIFNYPHYIHTDHLTGSNVTTKADGSLEETLDYYPYGQIKLDTTTTTFKERHKYTGHIYDASSELSYMGARYQDGKRGQFLSQDTAFLALGSPNLKEKTGMSIEQYLSDPQQLNSYSYARNNPLVYVDPNGDFSLRFSDWANSRPEYTPEQVQSTAYNKLPYYYRQTGDPSGTARINSQKMQELGTIAASLALMFAGSESNVSGLLRDSEGLGGHAIERHTGKTIGDLGGRFGTNFSGQYSSAFYSEAVGDVATYNNIQNNLGKVQAWLNGGSKNPLNLTSTLDMNVGFGIDRSGQVYNGIKDIRTVLQKTGNANGYIIKTSFPKIRGVRR